MCFQEPLPTKTSSDWTRVKTDINLQVSKRRRTDTQKQQEKISLSHSLFGKFHSKLLHIFTAMRRPYTYIITRNFSKCKEPKNPIEFKCINGRLYYIDHRVRTLKDRHAFTTQKRILKSVKEHWWRNKRAKKRGEGDELRRERGLILLLTCPRLISSDFSGSASRLWCLHNPEDPSSSFRDNLGGSLGQLSAPDRKDRFNPWWPLAKLELIGWFFGLFNVGISPA